MATGTATWMTPAGSVFMTEFEYAINGGKANALELVQPSADQQIYIHTKDENYNGVAQIQRWTMTTDRESVDLTVLGNEYRDNYSNGLISGQGELQCLLGIPPRPLRPNSFD